MILFICGIVLLLSGLVLTFNHIKQNSFCGFQNRWTLSDPFVWSRTNSFSGEFMVLWGGVLIYSHDLSPRGSALLIAVPAAFIMILSTLFSSLLFYSRWKTFHVPFKGFTRSFWKPSFPAEILAFFIPAGMVIVFSGTWLHIPSYIPVTYSIDGLPLVWGHGNTLGRVFVSAMILSAILSCWASTLSYPDSSSGWSLYITRLGVVLALVSYGVSLLFSVEPYQMSPWFIMALPLLVLLAGGGWLLWCGSCGGLGKVTSLAEHLEDNEELAPVSDPVAIDDDQVAGDEVLSGLDDSR